MRVGKGTNSPLVAAIEAPFVSLNLQSSELKNLNTSCGDTILIQRRTGELAMVGHIILHSVNGQFNKGGLKIL